jgi:hypothetical protein
LPSAADANAPHGVVGETAAAVILRNELLKLLLIGSWKLGWFRMLQKLAPVVNLTLSVSAKDFFRFSSVLK